MPVFGIHLDSIWTLEWVFPFLKKKTVEFSEQSLNVFLVRLPFLFFSCLFALTRAFSMLLNSSSEIEHPSLSCSWSLGESFQSFPVAYDVDCGFFNSALYYIEEVPFYALLTEYFYHESVLDFVKHHFCVIWNNHVGIFLHAINVMYYTD